VRIAFRLVDVFTDRPLAGNQLCVVPDAPDLPDHLKQALAGEIGFSETTFVTEADGDRYALRIFTPAAEIPFAGHPTLGTAFVLVSEGRVSSPATQSSPAGEVPVEVDVDAGFARMRQFEPAFGARIEDRRAVAEPLGLGPDDLHPSLVACVVSTGTEYLIVPAASEAAVASAHPDPVRLGVLLADAGAHGCYLFSSQGQMAKARAFFVDSGLDEDPGTGSAAGPLGAYLLHEGATEPGRLTISQGVEVGRPCTLLVDVADGGGEWQVFVGGGV